MSFNSTFRVKNTDLTPQTLVNLFPRRVLREICRRRQLYVGRNEIDSARNICQGRGIGNTRIIFHLEFKIEL